jgi:hypothetical protein
MRLIIALLIAALAGAGMGYSFGYARNVELKRTAAKPIFQPWEFDDYYADPATRPTTLPTQPRVHRPPR